MYRKKYMFLIVFIFLINSVLILMSEGDKKKMQLIKKISSKEAYEMMKKNANNPDFIIIDVRTEAEYKQEHIKNAKNINLNSIDFEKNLEKLDKNKEYLVHCRSGHRSAIAVKKMKDMMFMNVYDFGGLIDWKKAGYPVEK